MENYIPLKELEIYKLAKKLSKIGWEIYDTLNWRVKKITGDQFIESTDSVGANIAEGYRRFHYLERIKFCYNSRASLSESCDHWLELLYEREKVDIEKYKQMKQIAQNLSVKLNNYISSQYRGKKKQK